jgi:glycosyltransferase involved in cell wall biosynthesis
VNDFLVGYFIGRRTNQILRDSPAGSAAVISNGPVGWFPMSRSARQVHVYHGTYAGVAETSREFISYLGYLKLKYWDAGVLERISGRGKTCLCVSNQVADEVLRHFGYRSEVCWLPLDVDRFRPMGEKEKWRRHWGLPATAPVGLFVGNTSPYKGFTTVWEIVRRDAGISWLLVLRGDVPPAGHPANCRILQNVPHADLPGIYAAADFALVPYRLGPFSYALAEALVCGLPVIASPRSTSPPFLCREPLSRLLVGDQADVAEFENAIHEVVNRPDFYRAAVWSVREELKELVQPNSWADRFCKLACL